MSAHTATGPARRERGFSYAIAGAVGVTLVTLLVGGALFAWLILATRGPSAPELIPADAQLYAALPSNVGGVIDVNQLQSTLRQGFGVPDPASLAAPLERLLGASILDDVATWLGSELAVAVRGAEAAALQTPEAGQALLREGEVIFLFGSKNDPQAEVFLAKHRAAREAGGATIVATQVGDATIYAQEGGEPSPVAAFGLIDHYVVFSNSAAALRAMAAAEGGASLADVPAFAAFREQQGRGPAAVYTDGSAEAELARAALRDLIGGLK